MIVLFVMVFSAKSPCSIGKADDEIKLVLSIVMRFGDQAEGSSVDVQCDNCGMKSNCSSCVGLFTLEVIQFTRFLLGFGADEVEHVFVFFQLGDCSFSPQNETSGLSFFGVFGRACVDLIIGISKEDENNGS